jgi:hypothetical protein
MIIKVQTNDAFDTLVNLWSYKRPHFTENAPEMFIRHIYLNLPSARSIFPQILKLQEDRLLGPYLFSYYQQLLDSGYLQMRDLRPYESRILRAARGYIDGHRWAKEDMDPAFYHISNVLMRFEDDSVTNFFQKNLTHVNLSVKFNAVCGLLYLHKAVSPAVCALLAQNPDWRLDLFDSLSHYHKESLFPISYRSQKAFAEAYLMTSLDDYYENPEDPTDGKPSIHLTWIKDTTAEYKMINCRFILFDVKAGKDHFLGTAGPFDVDGKSWVVPVKDDVSGIYDKEALDLKELPRQFGAYMQQIRENRKSSSEEATTRTGGTEDER